MDYMKLKAPVELKKILTESRGPMDSKIESSKIQKCTKEGRP